MKDFILFGENKMKKDLQNIFNRILNKLELQEPFQKEEIINKLIVICTVKDKCRKVAIITVNRLILFF